MTAEAAAVQVGKIVGGLFRLEHYSLPGVETKLNKIVYSDNQNISIWNGASLSHDFTSKKKKGKQSSSIRLVPLQPSRLGFKTHSL